MLPNIPRAVCSRVCTSWLDSNNMNRVVQCRWSRKGEECYMPLYTYFYIYIGALDRKRKAVMMGKKDKWDLSLYGRIVENRDRCGAPVGQSTFLSLHVSPAGGRTNGCGNTKLQYGDRGHDTGIALRKLRIRTPSFQVCFKYTHLSSLCSSSFVLH